VLGIGGLGHMALQYARKMGFKVVAIGRGQDIAQDAVRLGAHVYVDTNEQDAAKALIEIGGAQAIIAIIGKADVVSPPCGGARAERPVGVARGRQRPARDLA